VGGVHLLDETTGEYNISFYRRFELEGRAVLVRGYSREQGLILPKGNPKRIHGFEDILGSELSFINRNRGSGTRILVDLQLSKTAKSKGMDTDELTRMIRGYSTEAKSHSAVAAAVAHGRADVGVGIRTVAETRGLDFVKIGDESFDFLVAGDCLDKQAVRAFLDTLRSSEFAALLAEKTPGLAASPSMGTVLAQ
jgi:putative molybdopterin biosynthesis protein